jgi:hypothetical protein
MFSHSAAGAPPHRRPKQPPPPGSVFQPSDSEDLCVNKLPLMAALLYGRIPGSLRHLSPYQFATGLRRCGKSTALTCLEQMARGKKEYFGDLVDHPDLKALEATVGRNGFRLWETKLPAICLDFSGVSYFGGDGRKGMTSEIRRAARWDLGIDLTCDPEDPASALRDLVRRVQDKTARQGFNGGVDDNGGPQVVLLIDEYDAPITEKLFQPPAAGSLSVSTQRMEAMSELYSTIKALGKLGVFHLVFVTAVTKLAHAAMISERDDNNVNFTTLLETHPEFSSLFFFTEPEIRATYGPWIEANLPAFQKNACDGVIHSVDSVLEDMKEWYGGYRVHPEAPPAALLNPYSVLMHLTVKRVTRAWTGSCPSAPSFVLRTLLGLSDSDLRVLGDGVDRMSWDEVTAKRAGALSEMYASPRSGTGSFEAMRALCMHAGLLTIKSAERVGGDMDSPEYALKIGTPNREVTEYFLERGFESLVGRSIVKVNAQGQVELEALVRAVVLGRHDAVALHALRVLQLVRQYDDVGVEASFGEVLFRGLPVYRVSRDETRKVPPVAVQTREDVSTPVHCHWQSSPERPMSSDAGMMMVAFKFPGDGTDDSDCAAVMEVIALKTVRTLADVAAALKDGVEQSTRQQRDGSACKSYFETCRDAFFGSARCVSQFSSISLAQQRGLVLVAVLPTTDGATTAGGRAAACSRSFVNLSVEDLNLRDPSALTVSAITSQGWQIEDGCAVAWLGYNVRQ